MSDEPGGEVILYRCEDGTPAIEVRFEDETLWLSQQQLADLFQTTRENITMHLRNIFAEGELDPAATSKAYLQVRQEGARAVRRSVVHYNLDAVISVGYRVRTKLATQFRIWATERLGEYLTKGFTMDDAKLKRLGGGSYWRELLGRIRDIRSSEKVLYRQVLDLYATSMDYDPSATETVEFFKVVQNKLHYAAHGHTAAEVVHARADATQPNMGLTSFPGARPRKSDVAIAKNSLDERELAKLNSIVSAYFDAAEFRAQNRQPTYMQDWLGHLDRLIGALDAPLLTNPGTISHERARQRAETEYARYRERLDADPSEVERAYLDSIKRMQHELEGGDS